MDFGAIGVIRAVAGNCIELRNVLLILGGQRNVGQVGGSENSIQTSKLSLTMRVLRKWPSSNLVDSLMN